MIAAENLPKIDIGIITIKDEEFSSIINRLSKKEILSRPKHNYIFQTIISRNRTQYNVAVARTLEQGTLAAQSLTSDMIEELNPAWLFLVGIAGGVPSAEFSLGDVLLCTRLYDFSVCCYDKDSQTTFALSGGPIHKDVAKLLEILPAYRNYLETCGWNSRESLRIDRPEIDLTTPCIYGEEKWQKNVMNSLICNFSEYRKPKYYLGPTGSSDILIKDDLLLDGWLKFARNLANVEMELAGVYRAAQQSNIPVLAIRSLSDIVGYKRSPEWTQFACEAAASFAICLVQSGIINLPNPKQSMDLVTNLEYLDFIQSSGYVKKPRHWNRSRPFFHKDEEDAPVIGVSWDDAVEYCDWIGGCLPRYIPCSPSSCGYAEKLDLTADGMLGSKSDGSTSAIFQVIGEWFDGGNERSKMVYNPQTSILVAVADRETPQRNVGFRCISVQPITQMREIFIEGASCRLGVDAERFAHIAEIFYLPSPLKQQILRRNVKSYKLRDFKISATCVTNEEYYRFTREVGRKWPVHWNARWFNRSKRPFPARLASLPVVNVRAEDARAYCSWSRTRLPNWMEWECVASGLVRRSYPWGNEYCAARCNSKESGRGSLADVNEFPLGDTPEGVRQLCGNVSEWVESPDRGFELRGGSYKLPCELWGLTYVFREAPSNFSAQDVGFRIVID